MSHSSSSLSLTHRLWRALPAGPRRQVLASATALLAPKPDRNPPPAANGLAVAGEISRPSGLGEGARHILAALAGMHTPSVALDLGDPTVRSHERLTIPPPGMPLVIYVNAPLMPLALLRMPRRLIKGRRVIGYWAWELPTMPASWKVGLDFVHEIWVPSQFTADAVATMLPPNSDIQLRVMPNPLAISPLVCSALTRADFGMPEGAVVTLVSFNLASSFARKNPLAAIAAHRAAFGNRPDRILLIKLTNTGFYPDDYQALVAAAHGLDNVRFDTRTLSAADRYALTACADIVLSLHRSEGLGLVPAEAMMLGVPVVATGWSGTTEFMDANSARMVDYRLVPAIDPRGVFEAPNAVWAEANIESAAAHLRELADNADQRAALGEAGRRMVHARLDDRRLRAAVQEMGLPVL